MCDYRIAYGAIRYSGLGVFEHEICMSEGYNLLFEVLLN